MGACQGQALLINLISMAQNRAQKLKELRKKLKELEEIKLKEALVRYGETYQETSAWNENAAWELADEEVSVLRAMIGQIKSEIRNLEIQKRIK